MMLIYSVLATRKLKPELLYVLSVEPCPGAQLRDAERIILGGSPKSPPRQILYAQELIPFMPAKSPLNLSCTFSLYAEPSVGKPEYVGEKQSSTHCSTLPFIS